MEGQENIQEILSKQLYLCQFLTALSIVRPGSKENIFFNFFAHLVFLDGHFVCKLFDLFTPFSIGLIYLMYRTFNHISIHKPVTSRPANSERFVNELKNDFSIHFSLVLVISFVKIFVQVFVMSFEHILSKLTIASMNWKTIDRQRPIFCRLFHWKFWKKMNFFTITFVNRTISKNKQNNEKRTFRKRLFSVWVVYKFVIWRKFVLSSVIEHYETIDKTKFERIVWPSGKFVSIYQILFVYWSNRIVLFQLPDQNRPKFPRLRNDEVQHTLFPQLGPGIENVLLKMPTLLKQSFLNSDRIQSLFDYRCVLSLGEPILLLSCGVSSIRCFFFTSIKPKRFSVFVFRRFFSEILFFNSNWNDRTPIGRCWIEHRRKSNYRVTRCCWPNASEKNSAK